MANNTLLALRRRLARAARDRELGTTIPEIYLQATRTPIDQRMALFVHRGLQDGTADFDLVEKHLHNTYGFTTQHISLGYGRLSRSAYYRNCHEFAQQAARAHFIFLNDASPVVSCLPLRPETKVMQLWHACGAFKKWGASTINKEFGATSEDLGNHPTYANLSLLPVSSPAVVNAYIEAMGLENTPNVVQALGTSRTDYLLRSGFAQKARNAIEYKHPECLGKTIVLYTPTFRGHILHAQPPTCLDIEQLCHILGDRYHVLIRHHPFIKHAPLLPSGVEGRASYASSHLSTYELLGAADMLVTDYSSIIFDYSLLGRPMAFLAPDKEAYDRERGWYFGYENFVPGPVFDTTAQVGEWLISLNRSDDIARVDAFRKTYMNACDGKSTERICTTILDL